VKQSVIWEPPYGDHDIGCEQLAYFGPWKAIFRMSEEHRKTSHPWVAVVSCNSRRVSSLRFRTLNEAVNDFFATAGVGYRIEVGEPQECKPSWWRRVCTKLRCKVKANPTFAAA